MDNLIFSLNATLPIFLVMVIGFLLRHKDMINENFNTGANKFIFNVALPSLLYQNIANTDIRAVFDMKFVLFCAVVTSTCFWVIWGVTKKVMKDQSMIGAFVQASFRGSAAVLGIAFIQNIYGTSAMGPLMIVSSVPLYNIYSVIVLTFESSNGRGKNIKSAFINVCKNPIIIGILAGVIASLLQVDFPVIIDKTIENLALIATPLALIVIGSSFEGKKALTKIRPTIVAAFIKLLLQPIVFLPLAVYMGFHDEKLISILIMLAAPTTVSTYIMAKDMKHDAVLTSSIIVLTTLLSAFTITGWIYVLRIFDLI